MLTGWMKSTKKGLRSDMFPLRKLDDQPTSRRSETGVGLLKVKA